MGIRLDGTNSAIKGKNAMYGQGPVAVSFTSDANKTLVLADYECPLMVVTSTVALTATRNMVLPLQNGAVVWVYNGTTGAQSIQIIGATGTGYTLANAKHACLRCDGVNWVKMFVEA